MIDFPSSLTREPPYILPRHEDKKNVLKTNFVEVIKGKV
jgi:hypothetical protein